MYLLSLLLFVLFCIGYAALKMNGSIVSYLDPTSLILLLLFTLPILLSAGLLRDFNNAFRLSAKRSAACSRTELLRAIEAVTLASKALWTTGILDTILQLIFIFSQNDIQMHSAYIGISLISLLYAAFLNILLLPLRARLMVRLHMLPENTDVPSTVNNTDSSLDHTT